MRLLRQKQKRVVVIAALLAALAGDVRAEPVLDSRIPVPLVLAMQATPEPKCFPPITEYINRGPDSRILGKVGAVVQNIVSYPFKWKRNPPNDVKIGNQMAAWPPFVALNIPYWRGSWFTLRIGWRYDVNCRRYIADVILKAREEMPLFY